MPTHEAIVNTVLPKEVEKPIPIRTVSTRPRPMPKINKDQTIKDKLDNLAEDSAGNEESLRLSPKASIIARREAAIRQRELSLKEREKEIEEKLAKAAQFEQLKSKLDAKDYSEAEALGMNYEDYVKYTLNKTEAEDPRDKRLQELEQKLSNFEKQREESINSQFEETKAEYRQQINEIVASNPNFSKVKKMNAEEHVLQLIIDTFDEDGTSLTVTKACEMVEGFLTEEKKKWDSLTEVEQEMARRVENEKPMLPKPTIGKTLTNEMMAGSNNRPQKSLQHLSDEERYAEARRRVLERRQLQGR